MTIERLLRQIRTIAVVGLSPNPFRPSHGVAQYMQRQGYRIIPVNPGHAVILGERCYPDLEAVPEPVDLVNVFRRPEHAPAVVEAAIRMGAPAIWFQEGVIHEVAAARARAAGLLVVMDRCLLKEHRSLRP
jgi:predicted CoA-binding protein